MDANNHSTHILLIEDDRDDYEIFDEVIHTMDRTVELTILKSCNDLLSVLPTLESLPDFIFLDVNLPGKSGLECIHEIKTHSLYSNLKVIVYCGAITQTVMQQALNKGADLCVVKPSSVKEIQALLQHIIYPT